MARTRSQSREPETHSSHPQNTRGSDDQNRLTRDERQIRQQLEPLYEDLSENENNADVDNASEVDDSEVASDTGEISDSDSAQYDTFSQTELQQLDPRVMQDNLEDLNAQARKLLGCFRTRTGTAEGIQSLAREVQDPKSRQRQKLDDCWVILEGTLKSFTRGGEFLKAGIILQSLLRKKHTQPLPRASQPWRPDDIIFKANLAILAHKFLTLSTDDETADIVMALDQIFASPFMHGFVRAGASPRAGESALTSETFEFALESRTQVLLGMLDADGTPEEAASMIQQAMLDFDANSDEYPDEMEAMQTLEVALSNPRYAKGWNLLDPHMHQTSEYAGAIVRRTQHIRRVLFDNIDDPFSDSTGSLDSGLAKLREEFSWERYKILLLRWVNLRLAEIDNSIRQSGGIDEIITALEEEIEQRLEDPKAYDDEHESSEEQVIISIENNALSTHDHATSVASVSSAKIAARPLSLFKGRPALTRLDRAHNAVLEQEREPRRFIDPQPNGHRIVDDILASQPISQRGFGLPSAEQQSPGGQAIEIDPTLEGTADDAGVESPSEDEGFQQDQRVLPNARPRPKSLAAPIRASALEKSTQTATRQREISEPDTPNKRPRIERRNPGQLLMPYRSTGDDEADSVRQVTLEARLETRKGLSKPQRARKEWTDQEIGALLRYIRDYGISWTRLKQIDDSEDGAQALEDRNAEDIRFKARELKVKYLIAQRQLPQNLDLVPLGKKEIEKVNRFLPYEQAPQRSRARIPAISPPRSPEI